MPDSDRYALLANPHIRLSGAVDHEMYDSFRQQLAACPATGPIAITITTLGGDPEVARMMGIQFLPHPTCNGSGHLPASLPILRAVAQMLAR